VHPHQLQSLTIEEQVFMVHLAGLFISTLDLPSKKINLCFWQNHFVEISCRFRNGHWTPYRVEYFPNSPAYINLLKRNLDGARFKQMLSALKRIR